MVPLLRTILHGACTLDMKTVSLLEKHRLHSLRADRRRPLELPTSSVDRLQASASLKVRDMLP